MLRKGLVAGDGQTYAFGLHQAERPSAIGIAEGRIERLRILRNNKTVCLYINKWVMLPSERGAEIALAKLRQEYN